MNAGRYTSNFSRYPMVRIHRVRRESPHINRLMLYTKQVFFQSVYTYETNPLFALFMFF
jgi:hypothetical protein